MGGTRTSPTLSQASQLSHLSKSSPFSHTANAREMPSPGATPPPKKLPIRRKEAASDTSNSTSDSAGSVFDTGSSGSPCSPRSLTPHDPTGDFVVPPHAIVLASPTMEGLAEAIKQLKDRFVSSKLPKSQYLHVIRLDQALIKRLEDQPDIFRGVRATISHQQAEILYKIMPGLQHEQMIGSFAMCLTEHLVAMGLSHRRGDFMSRQSVRTAGRYCSKEPDWWFGPNNILIDGGGKGDASLILEVGLSEPSGQLKADARWWHSNTGGGTKLVVLIHTSHKPIWTVDVEVWSEVDNPQPGPNTREHPAKIIQCTQRAHFENGVVHGGPLTLDFEVLMRRPPRNSHEANVVLDHHDLFCICAENK
jgi:hypothetical protein